MNRSRSTALRFDCNDRHDEETRQPQWPSAAQDIPALAALYDHHAGLVFGIALAILRSQEDAEDLTQEVFLAACDPGLYDPDRGSIRAFLTTLTRSRSIDRLRRRGRSARLLRSWGDPPARPGVASTVERVCERQRAMRVRQALAELSPDDRQALELAYWGGLSQTEIAAELAAPLGTVKSWCRRGLKKLKQSLADLGD